MTAVIQTHGLSKRYGSVLAVDQVDLRVDRGEIYGFLGLNGAGKTTTIRAILGMIRPSAGSVALFGAPISAGGRGPWRLLANAVVVFQVFQQVKLDGALGLGVSQAETPPEH